MQKSGTVSFCGLLISKNFFICWQSFGIWRFLYPNSSLFPDGRIGFQHRLYCYFFWFKIDWENEFITLKFPAGGTKLNFLICKWLPDTVGKLCINIDIVVLSFFKTVCVQMKKNAIYFLSKKGYG